MAAEQADPLVAMTDDTKEDLGSDLALEVQALEEEMHALREKAKNSQVCLVVALGEWGNAGTGTDPFDLCATFGSGSRESILIWTSSLMVNMSSRKYHSV